MPLSWIIHLKCNCPYCRGRRTGLSNCLATKNPELAKEWHPTLNGDLTPYNFTCGTNTKIWWICNENHIWESAILSRNSGVGCPECNASKGEKKIIELLSKNDIYNIPQKTFDGLYGMGNGNLSYDFYLPDHNLLIEYQGQYHDGTANNQKQEDFIKQQEHDKRKREYAKTHNIKLLEIWYCDFNNVEIILHNELNIIKKKVF